MYKFYLISLIGLFLFSCTKEVEKENPLLLGDNKDIITEEVA
ncbi:hypothetical protein [Capnocytophaga stomatis]|uniref:Uncharacterized protein n=1 Tax=Capnocytophaga stomatis TaxID=1848904 RepID=A0ABW8QAW2_9FLAO|nr:hypothetical protein [Capnocytophaga stomatis]